MAGAAGHRSGIGVVSTVVLSGDKGLGPCQYCSGSGTRPNRGASPNVVKRGMRLERPESEIALSSKTISRKAEQSLDKGWKGWKARTK